MNPKTLTIAISLALILSGAVALFFAEIEGLALIIEIAVGLMLLAGVFRTETSTVAVKDAMVSAAVDRTIKKYNSQPATYKCGNCGYKNMEITQTAEGIDLNCPKCKREVTIDQTGKHTLVYVGDPQKDSILKKIGSNAANMHLADPDRFKKQ
jgi:DNA-directed RNA polymerase subunit RPC12/RpoP